MWSVVYALQPRSPLNSLSGGAARQGALLKIETEFGIGYADLHPWVELGDLPLPAQLESLTAQRPTPLAFRSLALARLDAEARARRESAFAGLMMPLSHFLSTDVRYLNETVLENAWRMGFHTVKLKLGRDLATESAALHQLTSYLSAFSLRFDLNGASTPADFIHFIASLPEALVRSIEFVEDPAPWNENEWNHIEAQTGIELALDHQPAGVASLEGRSWLILKPAMQDPRVVLDAAAAAGARVVVTSYMDHPVGQSGAALVAAQALSSAGDRDRIAVCGLASQGVYEPNDFSRRLASGPHWVAADGFGIGFDELLAAQDWRAL